MDLKITQAPATLVRLSQKLSGTLHLTRHHMIFRADNREMWISYPIVHEVTRRSGADALSPSIMRILCKDFVFVCFEFENDQNAKDVYDTLLALSFTPAPEDLYAYLYSPAGQERQFDGWSLYNVENEFRRMGLSFDDTAGDCDWRLSRANQKFTICATYPQNFVVPASISDNVLGHAAKFRSKGRLPVISYYHAMNRCTISRCSQPLIGIKQNRNLQDEKLILDIFATTSPPSGVWGAQVDNLVVDLRPSTNALAQTAMGGGTENMDRYKPARKIYLGIDNLHVMRDSLNKVIDALRHGDISSTVPSHAALVKSQWLQHIDTVLAAATQVVQQIYYKFSHVLVHCSDGWDRTPQITSLSMLLLDPYYRTLEGFMVLVEKEWISFGHRFATRGGIYSRKSFTEVTDDAAQNMLTNVTNFISDTARNRQTGPIFQQFLDCVYQIVYANPERFEFNERFLRRLLYHSYSGQYGTFLFDSERERIEAQATSATRSVWAYFLARRGQFVNESYAEYQDVFLPPKQARWWAGAFGRTEEEMNDPEAWKKQHNARRGNGKQNGAASSSSSNEPQTTTLNTAQVQTPPPAQAQPAAGTGMEPDAGSSETASAALSSELVSDETSENRKEPTELESKEAKEPLKDERVAPIAETEGEPATSYARYETSAEPVEPADAVAEGIRVTALEDPLRNPETVA